MHASRRGKEVVSAIGLQEASEIVPIAIHDRVFDKNGVWKVELLHPFNDLRRCHHGRLSRPSGRIELFEDCFSYWDVWSSWLEKFPACLRS